MGESPRQVGPHRPQRRSSKLGGPGTSNHHKGVYFKQRSNKFVARLCLPGGKNRKLDLGEYNSHDAAACAYRVGAFYFNKPLESGDQMSFVESLPCVPDNLSEADKVIWVREQARQYATSEAAAKDQAAPGTLPTTDHQRYSFDLQSFQSEVMLPLGNSFGEFPVWDLQDAMENIPSSDAATKRPPTAQVLFSLPPSQQAAPALVMTGSIISAFQELCEQGWEVRLEPTTRSCDNV